MLRRRRQAEGQAAKENRRRLLFALVCRRELACCLPPARRQLHSEMQSLAGQICLHLVESVGVQNMLQLDLGSFDAIANALDAILV
jgi:hypothetical protein